MGLPCAHGPSRAASLMLCERSERADNKLDKVWGWVMVEFGTSSAFRGWVRVRVLGYGFGVRGKEVKSRDCALASDLVRASEMTINNQL